MKVATTIPAGNVFTITMGEYSDYNVDGVYMAVVDIEPDALLKQWLSEHPEQTESYRFEHSKFLLRLLTQNVMKLMHSFEWHITDYSSWSEMTLHETED